MKFIGLGHYSRTGKDTFARLLQEELNRLNPKLTHQKISFAWKLKQVAYELYSWAGLREPDFYETPEGAVCREIVLPALEMTPVDVWVAIGTKAIRNNVYDRTWLDYVLKSEHGSDVVIIPDVRFPNEFNELFSTNSLLVKVVRPGFGPRKTVADRALLSESRWHYVIGGGNKPELQEFAEKVARWLVFNEPLEPQTEEQRQWQLSRELVEPWEPVVPVHESPNGAKPGSFVFEAETAWLAAGYWPIPTESHQHLFQAMLDQFSDSHCCPATVKHI